MKFSDRLDEVNTASKEVKLHVLMDRSAHISFEGSHTYRVFGNIWEYNERTYLKGVLAFSFFFIKKWMAYLNSYCKTYEDISSKPKSFVKNYRHTKVLR